MLLVVAHEEVVNDEQDIVDVQAEALVDEQTALLGVVVRLEVVVEHVVEVGLLAGLLAEVDDALVDLVADRVLGSRHASHQSREDDEALRTVLLDQVGELLDALDSGH